MAKSMINDLTVGSVPGKLIRFSIPFILANFLQFLYNIVDMIIVGQFVGSAGLSAVSIGGEFMHFFTFIAVGFAQAGQVLIAQSIGKGTRGEGLSRIIGNLFAFILGLGLIVTAISVLFPRQFALLMNTPAESFSEAVSYCTVCGAGMFFVYGYNTVSHVMQGMGDSRHPLIFVAISAGLNLILDLLFVGVFHLRATGAALATVIGQSFSFIVSMIFLYRRRESFGFDFKLSSFKIYREQLRPLIKLGIPMSIQMASVTISKAVVSAWINTSGYMYSALNGIFSKLAMFMGIISNSMTSAGGASIAQCIGARKFERVPKIMGMVFLITGVICGAVSLFPTFAFQLFTTDPAVIDISDILIIPAVIVMLSGIFRSVGMSLINGSGNSRLNLIVAILDGIVVRIGLSYLLGFTFNMSVRGFWFGDAFAGYMPFVVGFVFLLTGRWKTNRHIIKEDN